MDVAVIGKPARLPRFRRAPEPPPFRLTPDDVEIVRQVARHRLLRSTHIAALVGRSLDRTNDRLKLLFHAAYLDRPRAQLDYYPARGSDHMVYALADRGARLLRQHGEDVHLNDWSRKNREAGRPFIEHQIEIVNFQVALERAVRTHPGLRLLEEQELIAASRRPERSSRDVFALGAKVRCRGTMRESRVIPDLVFGLALADGTRRCYVAEIDRGTMPVERSDPSRTSFAGKMRTYLAAYTANQHQLQFGWPSFRVLTITTDRSRMRTMQAASRELSVPRSPRASLFLFATFTDLRATTPLALDWLDGNNREVSLV
jgi:hypothetical protein